MTSPGSGDTVNSAVDHQHAGEPLSLTCIDLQRHNLDKVAVHVDAEFANDIPAIIDSITADCRYPLLHRTEDGGRHLEVITDLNGARVYYDQMREGVDIVASRQLRRITTEWYVFNHSIATIRHTGTVGGVAGTGREHRVQSAVLFPVTEDGILGEVPWNRHTWAELVQGVPERESRPDDPIAIELRNLDAHDAYADVLRTGDVAGLDGVITPDFCMASRNYAGAEPMTAHQSAAAAAEHIRAFHRALEVLEVIVLNRVVTEWFVFAEHLWRLRSRDAAVVPVDGEFDLKTAAIYPVDAAGRLAAELGYGTDMPLVAGRMPISAQAPTRTVSSRESTSPSTVVSAGA